jgi:hypothetical protein
MDDRSLDVPATKYDGTTSDTFVPAEMEAGPVRDGPSVDHLAWELLVSVAYVRLLYLHGRATEEQRRASPGEETCRLLPFLRGVPSGTANNRRVSGGRGSWNHRRRAFGSTLRIAPER